ncbi:MAG: YesL family protein [Clostridia bacterium]|nr:YesL family protein [Clostridia bacterium]
MGLFGFNQKDGPGIYKDAPQKNRFFNFFDIFFVRIWKVITLNVIYIIFCIPIVTIGPATCGLAYVLRKFANDEHAEVFSDFFDAFKKNFKQGLIVGIIEILFVAAFFYALQFYTIPENVANFPWFTYAVPLLYIGGGMYLFMRFYMYTIIVTFKVTIKQIYKNSFLFAVIGVVRNLLLTILAFVLVVMPLSGLNGLTLPIYLGAMVLIIPAFLGFVISYSTYPLLKKYMVDPYTEKKEEENLEESIFSDTIKK